MHLNLGFQTVARLASQKLDMVDIYAALARHASGDWGDVDGSDWSANDEALERGGRILSSYRAKDGTKFWIITEGDRSATTVLLPEEY